MKITASLTMPTVNEMMQSYGVNKNGKLQKYIDEFILRESEPFIPYDTGILVDSGIIASGGGQVIWNDPKAHYLYEGLVMVSPTTGSTWAKHGERKVYKTPQQQLHYKQEPQRKDHWFDRMIISKEKELIKGCQNIVNGGK